MPGTRIRAAVQQPSWSSGAASGPPLASDLMTPAAAVTGLIRATGCIQPARSVTGAKAELTKARTIAGKNSTRSAVSGSLISSASQAESTAKPTPKAVVTAVIAAMAARPCRT
jgi:hypothetical protein